MINILISVNKNYFDKAMTMLYSLRRYNQEDITVYLFNRSLSESDVKKFKNYLHRHLKMEFEEIDVSETEFEQLPVCEERFSVEMYYRVIAQFMLPKTVDRILWLDSDMVICGNVGEFYHQQFEEKLLVACPDVLYDGEEITKIKDALGLPKEHVYFNSGVLLLNIQALREKTSIEAIIHTAQQISKNFLYPDQDLLNYLYVGQIKYCDKDKYNCQALGFKNLTKAQIKDIIILHYAGMQKPWKFYYLYELSKASIPYCKTIALQGKWFTVIKLITLYALWVIYYKTGICKIVRKQMMKGK